MATMQPNTYSPDYPPIFLVEDNPVDVDLTLRAFARQGIRNPGQSHLN